MRATGFFSLAKGFFPCYSQSNPVNPGLFFRADGLMDALSRPLSVSSTQLPRPGLSECLFSTRLLKEGSTDRSQGPSGALVPRLRPAPRLVVAGMRPVAVHRPESCPHEEGAGSRIGLGSGKGAR